MTTGEGAAKVSARGYKESIIHTECCRIYPALVGHWLQFGPCVRLGMIFPPVVSVCCAVAGSEVDMVVVAAHNCSKPLPSRKIIQPEPFIFFGQVLPHFASVRSFTKPDTHIYDIIIRKTNAGIRIIARKVGKSRPAVGFGLIRIVVSQI